MLKVRNAGAALAAGIICTGWVAPCSLAEARPTDQQGSGYFRYYHKQRQALALDATRIAVRGADLASLTPALAAAGLDAAKAEANVLTGWWLVSVAQPAVAADIEKLVAAVAAQPGVERASPVFVDDFGGAAWVFGDLMIGFPAAATFADRDAMIAATGAGKLAMRDYTLGVDRVTPATNNGFEILAKANELAERGDVMFAEPDYAFSGKSSVIPNDTFFGTHWGIHNTGQSGGVVDQDMDGPEAWDITTGSNAIIVTIIDVGTDLTHPDLNLAPGVDTTGSPGLVGAPGNACDHHGTAVAGCVSARFNNNLGVVGIAPACRSSSARAFVSTLACNGSWNSSASFTVDALNFAQAQGHRVTNNSNGYGFTSATIDTAYLNTYNAGLVHFASNGNSGAGTVGYPANIPIVNGISALMRNGNITGFSQFGVGTNFSAPGQAIDSTDRQGGAGYTATDYATVDGTSFASPYAAGVAALVISRNPGLTSAQVETIMQNTAVDRGPAGFDNTYGSGFVNAFAAVQAALPAPANNACGNAIDVSAGGTFNGTLAGATNDGTASCGSSATNPDVWYRYTSGTCVGRLTVTTCGTHDTGGANAGMDSVLSLHTACGGTEITCIDDTTTGCIGLDITAFRDSLVTADLAANTTVLIRVSKFSTVTSGTFRLNVSFGPANDLCANASTILASVATPFCTTPAATDGPIEALCFGSGDNNVHKDIWYRYTPIGKGRFSVRTCDNTAFDTKVAIYPNICPGATGTVLSCNDDACNGTRTIVTHIGVAGTPYLLRVGGFNGTSGTGTLIVYCAADINFSGVVSVQDIFDFLGLYFGNNPTADINGVGGLSVQDIFDFLETYFSGC